MKTIQDASDSGGAISSGHVDVVLISAFIVMFCLKETFDDFKHFAEKPDGRERHRYAGFIVAVFFWIILAVAGFFVYKPGISALILCAFMAMTTIWVGIHVLEMMMDANRREEESGKIRLRVTWIIINCSYLIVLIAYVLGIAISISRGDTLLNVSGKWFLGGLFVILAYDMWISRSYPAEAV
ncbi:hypothetical protein N177_1777 [Lutibaculum baratangense AMV1]|uniref:Uncharacterized protein n=1 Tax=Lutibaculum baratangense AMV1 TaxID=631454 RepID=V4RPZ8_9HYPH|nr:hypothetical protein N177_1777 [Lutibaculum baratangense AMV1]